VVVILVVIIIVAGVYFALMRPKPIEEKPPIEMGGHAGPAEDEGRNEGGSSGSSTAPLER
jgi:hypothetical protein